MKPNLVLVTLFVLCASIQGCKLALYPVALASGGPTEGELKLRRVAFERLKAGVSTARFLVYPVVQPAIPGGAPYQGTAEQAVALLCGTDGFSNCAPSGAPPDLAATPMMGNQLRYREVRASAYTGWVKRTRPDAGFLVIIEVVATPSGGIEGVQSYVLEESGQVAYARHFNSHHFGGGPLGSAASATEFAVRVLLQDLRRPAAEIHPPYGVG